VEQVHPGQQSASKAKPLILDDGRLLRVSDDGRETAKLAAFSPGTGKLMRRYEASLNIRENKYGSRRPLFTYDDGVIYQCDQLRLRAIDAKADKALWFSACGPVNSKREMFDLFALDNGELFTYGHAWCRLDQATGKVLAYGSIGGNARCDTGACTANLVVAGFGNYFDLASGALRWKRNDLARGQCGGWGTPAYGMVYHHGSGCGCFWPIRGNMALHHTALPKPIANTRRLARGPAFGRPLGDEPAEGDWPAYLCNGRRLAWGTKDGPRRLKETWRVKVGEAIPHDVEGVGRDWLVNGIYNGPVTAPVVANSRVFAADRDRHRVVAIDARAGRQQWSFQADGRVLTTPTYAKGRLVFGARDGYVYALDAKTGELAWNFMAAPVQRYLLAYGQLKSVWPVHGCLPVVGDTVIVTAGYHAEADGGIWAWGLSLKTGDITWARHLERMERPWQSSKRASLG